KRIENEVLKGRETLIGIREKEQGGIPKDDKADGEPDSAFEFADNFPGRDDDGESHDEPQKQANDAEFNDDRPIAALHVEACEGHVENAAYILRTQRGGANAKAVGPPRVVKGIEEILDGIGTGAAQQFAVGIGQRERLPVKGEAVCDFGWEKEDRQSQGEGGNNQGALEGAQHPDKLSALPRATPQESNHADKGASHGPK